MLSPLLLPALAGLGLSTALPTYPTNTTSTFNWNNTNALIAFGDSYTYVQGTAGRQNYSFIGDFLDGNFSYTPEKLLANRIVQNPISTAEGGPNWVEYLTGCGLAPGLTDPQSCSRQLWDFAFAGSDISQEYLALHHPYTVPLVNQTQQFSTYAAPTLSTILDPTRTLVALWIGINDIGDSALFTNITSFADFYSTLLDAEFAAAERDVLSKGYKDYLFMNLPPLDRTPGNVVRAGGPRPNATMVQEWDDSLVAHAQAFAERNPGTRVAVFDVHGVAERILADPLTYGLLDTTTYCKAYAEPFINDNPGYYGCRPLDEYFWFNTGHLTSHVHQLLATEVQGFLQGSNNDGWRFGGF